MTTSRALIRLVGKERAAASMASSGPMTTRSCAATGRWRTR